MKLKIGDYIKEEFTISQNQVNQFAELTGDKNPLHIDAFYASKTRFKKPIVHGLFTVTAMAKIMGTKFPGEGTIHVSQNYSFKKPVFPETKYIVYIELIKVLKKKHLGFFKTQIIDKKSGKIIIDGTGMALHDKKL